MRLVDFGLGGEVEVGWVVKCHFNSSCSTLIQSKFFLIDTIYITCSLLCHDFCRIFVGSDETFYVIVMKTWKRRMEEEIKMVTVVDHRTRSNVQFNSCCSG